MNWTYHSTLWITRGFGVKLGFWGSISKSNFKSTLCGLSTNGVDSSIFHTLMGCACRNIITGLEIADLNSGVVDLNESRTGNPSQPLINITIINRLGN